MDGTVVVIMLSVIVVVAIMAGSISGIVRRHMRFKKRELEIMAGSAAEQAAQYAAKAEKLEQRVRVLERIATDRGSDLAQQIEDLRREEEGKERIQ